MADDKEIDADVRIDDVFAYRKLLDMIERLEFRSKGVRREIRSE
jgi:hypothetical protein